MNTFLLKISGQAENRLYGHLDILANYCEQNRPRWLNGYLQHGWNGCDGFSNYAGSKRKSKKFIWSKRSLNDLLLRGGKNATVIGSPWLYNLKLNNKLHASPKSNSKKIIAYPLHSQPWAPKNYLHEEYSNFLKNKYGNITVCLHWSEYSKSEIYSVYKNMGHDPITYGVGSPWLEGFDKKFLDKQIFQLSNHGKLVTNAMQTSVLYALSLGLEIEFGGPASWEKKIDEFGTYGDRGQEYWKYQVLNEPEVIWKTELGFDDLLSPENLKTKLEWDTEKVISKKFILTRSLDILQDGSLREKFSYFKKDKN